MMMMFSFVAFDDHGEVSGGAVQGFVNSVVLFDGPFPPPNNEIQHWEVYFLFFHVEMTSILMTKRRIQAAGNCGF